MRRPEPAILLVPLVSWATPAHVPEGYLLKSSLRQCGQRLGWRPDIVVGDLAYIHQQTKKEVRQAWQVAVVTKMKSDMNIVEPFDDWDQMSCGQGQPLHWLGYDPAAARHWFGVASGEPPLCSSCWEASTCPREFCYPPDHHETLLGLLPLNTMVARRLLGQVRSWIEPCHAYEKNLLGLKRMFLNSLRLTWTLCLLADAAGLLRALACLSAPKESSPLQELLPRQMSLRWKNESIPRVGSK